jgi:DNA-binding LytR/AlgR family response regulator
MITAIAIDDQKPALKIMENFCSKTEGISLLKTFENTDEALKYLNKFPVDLIFLDVNMPKISGIDFSKKLVQNQMVVFITADKKFAADAFEVNAVDYLVKPLTEERFKKAVQKAIDFFHLRQKDVKPENKFLFVRADYKLIKVPFEDILCIEGLGDFLKIFVRNQKTIVARIRMKEMEDRLPASDFIRVHRSFILPIAEIKGIKNNFVMIEGRNIPIGGHYEEGVDKLLKESDIHIPVLT